MFVKNILKAFTPDTQIEVYLDDNLLDYGTVEEFMNSGLMTYATIDEDSLLEIEDNKIIIFLN
jgi:hypothetical protein